jgi:hypothetical protein
MEAVKFSTLRELCPKVTGISNRTATNSHRAYRNLMEILPPRIHRRPKSAKIKTEDEIII